MDRVEELMRIYRLRPHPEGGAFSEVYTSAHSDAEGRACMGSIYFLLDGVDISHLHVIDCDELWYYHEGCGMRVTMIDGEGNATTAELGPDMDRRQRARCMIPAGTVFAAENLDAAGYSFVSCATSPKFRYEGFRLVGRAEIAGRCPAQAQALMRLAYGE